MATFEEALQEAYASAPASAVILSCLEFRHTSFATPVRMVRDPGEYISSDEDTGIDIFGLYLTLESDAPINPGASVLFQSCMFKVKLPEQQEAKITGLELQIDNATQILSKKLDEIVTVRSPLYVMYREYLGSDLTTPQFIISHMTITSVTATNTMVTATAEFDDLVNRKFPDRVYRPEEYRSLLL